MEHFAHEGALEKAQADSLFADVYIARLPQNTELGDLACKERIDEINACTNEAIKREKYFAFRLLCHAFAHSFDISEAEIPFKKESCGGWSAGKYFLSISHSQNALAVAVSLAPVGVDIERVYAPRAEEMAHRFLTERELALFENTPKEQKEEVWIKLWTAKEAAFKAKQKPHFKPTETDSTKENVYTDVLSFGGELYAWSVAAEKGAKVRVFSDVTL